MITIDADGQHRPRDLRKFIPLLQGDDAAILIGVRKFDADGVPRRSLLGRDIGRFWLRIETGVSLEDPQSGFRAYPVEHLSQLPLEGSRFEFEVEVLARAVWAGLELRTVEVDVWYPEPQLRVSSFRPVVDNFRISCMHARLVGRRLLPLPHRRLVSSTGDRFDPRALLHPIKLLRSLLAENATPGLLGLSAGTGVFLGALPLISLHTVVIIYVGTRLRLNRVMAVAAQNVCMPPFVPVICIELGHRIRFGRWLTELSMQTVFAEAHHRLFEWLLGSLVVAPVAGVLFGGLVFVAARAIQGRTRRRRDGARA
jgi:uncharacterized protein (DUF2062 family)